MILVSASCATSRGQTRDGAGGGGPIIQRSSDGRGRIRPRIRGYYIVHAIRNTSGRYAILVRVNPISPDVWEGRHPLREVSFLALFNKALFGLCHQWTGIHDKKPAKILSDVTPLGFSHRDREKSRVVCAPIVKLTEDLRFLKKYHWIGNFKLILKMVFKLKIKQKMTKL